MAAKESKQELDKAEEKGKRAGAAMAEIRNALYRRLVEYILENEGRLKEEIGGEDSYSFTLQQMEEQFLNKFNVIERALGELARCEYREGQTTTTTYETVEVIAKRADLPQKVADALAEHGTSDFLDLCVLRADDKQAEVLLILVREDNTPSTTANATAQKTEEKSKRATPEAGGHGEKGEQGEDHDIN